MSYTGHPIERRVSNDYDDDDIEPHDFETIRDPTLQHQWLIQGTGIVCYFAQCDLQDIVTCPEFQWLVQCPIRASLVTGDSPKCCASDFTLDEIKTLCVPWWSPANDSDASNASRGIPCRYIASYRRNPCMESIVIVVYGLGSFIYPWTRNGTQEEELITDLCAACVGEDVRWLVHPNWIRPRPYTSARTYDGYDLSTTVDASKFSRTKYRDYSQNIKHLGLT